MSSIYRNGVILLNTTHNWTSTAKQVALVRSGYTPNIDTHTNASDLTNECDDASYGRQALVNPVTGTGTNQVQLNADDTVFPNLDGGSAQTPTYAVIIETTGGAAICYSTLTAPPDPNGGNYTIEWAATGCFVYNITP